MIKVFDAGNVWVVKVGSSLLTSPLGLAVKRVTQWVEDIVYLKKQGIKVVLVSSGAVAEGMGRLGLSERPESVHLLQAAAAVGQMGLIQLYESNFMRHSLHTAQILLTHDDLRSRERYLNARVTLKTLIDMNVVPIVNENDTVVTDEIRFGDNDNLAALVANLIEANTLILLTDQDGLFDRDPRLGNAQLVDSAMASDPKLKTMAGPGTDIGQGGMITKIQAAQVASRSGANTVITSGHGRNVLRNIAKGRLSGTCLKADKPVLASRKQWLATLVPQGQVILDTGAVKVLKSKGRSLLPVGVRSVIGQFTRGDMVSCLDENGSEIARGLINYSDEESRLIIGKSSSTIESKLGFLIEQELIHRDNLVISV